ncbi:MAG: DUF5335 family protein [Gemmatimonadaceae bacterium]
MAETKKIPHDQLVQYFDSFTKRFLRDNVPEGIDVEVMSPDWGHQQADKGVRLEGITYDTHTDALEFALDVGDHRVLKPQEVWTVEEPDGFVTSIEVVRADGEKEVITIKHDGLRRLPDETRSNR